MKKKILVCVACISIVTVQAQDRPEHVAPAPPPPPIAMMAPAPPPPPVPPVPPAAPEAPEETATIVNELGNEISVSMGKGSHMVIIKRDGKIRKIKLNTWMANRKFHEKKYGQLPPPPPPPPVPAIEPM